MGIGGCPEKARAAQSQCGGRGQACAERARRRLALRRAL